MKDQFEPVCFNCGSTALEYVEFQTNYYPVRRVEVWNEDNHILYVGPSEDSTWSGENDYLKCADCGAHQSTSYDQVEFE